MVDHIEKLASNNMNVESAVGQSKYLVQKTPNYSLGLIDAKARIKMNQTLSDDRLKDIQSSIQDETLRKTAREFRQEMQQRHKSNC